MMESEDPYHQSGLYSHHRGVAPTTRPIGNTQQLVRQSSTRKANSLSRWKQSPPHAAFVLRTGSSGSSGIGTAWKHGRVGQDPSGISNNSDLLRNIRLPNTNLKGDASNDLPDTYIGQPSLNDRNSNFNCSFEYSQRPVLDTTWTSGRSSNFNVDNPQGNLDDSTSLNWRSKAFTSSTHNFSNIDLELDTTHHAALDASNTVDNVMEESAAIITTVDSTAELVNSNPVIQCRTSVSDTVTYLTSRTVEESDVGDVDDCGIFSFRPALLQPLANIKVFVFLLSILVMVQQALASGYLNSVITTIEKRFEIPSYLTGVISSFYEIGNVITVIFVSYLGSKRRIPVWIAVGCLVMGIGSMLFVIPQLIGEGWSIHSPSNASESDNICRSARVRDDTSEILGEIGFGTLPDLSKGLGHSNGLQYTQRDNCIEGNKSNAFPVFFFVIAQLLLGAGGSPLLTLGTTYIDDHVKKESSSMYIGIIYTMVAFGPVLGFLLGGYLLSYYVDSFFVPDSSFSEIDHKHPRWIGMWWGGFLLCGLLLIALSLPFFMFPKSIKKEKEKVRLEEKSKTFQKGHRRTKSQTSTCSRHSTLSTKRVYGKDVRDIPMSMLKLLVNPIYVMTCLGACMELIIVSGFVVFLPKYLETQFSLSNIQASILTGGIAIPGACIGTFLGGYLLKRLSLRPKGAIQMVMSFNLLGLSLYGLLFVLGCDNVKMAGTTSPYFNSTLTRIPVTSSLTENVSGRTEVFEVNLTAWCNSGCSCSSHQVEPVCGSNGLTYFSPCHAGCSSANAQNFLNCSCIQGGDLGIQTTTEQSLNAAAASRFREVTAVPVATAGPCFFSCNTIKPFMILLFFMSSAVAISQMPLLMIVLRSVDEEERSFALGVQFVIFRLIAYIPAPIMFGTVIDSTCLLWKTSCDGEMGGRCLLYDIEQFRYRYVGICTGIKVLSAIIFLLDWFLIRWKYKLDMEGTMTVGDIVNSLMSVDRGGDDQENEELQEDNVWLTELQGTQMGHFCEQTIANDMQDQSGKHQSSNSSTHFPIAASTRQWPSHKRSHSTSGYQPVFQAAPAHGILSTQPGHHRRASAGQQVTFRGLDRENLKRSEMI